MMEEYVPTTAEVRDFWADTWDQYDNMPSDDAYVRARITRFNVWLNTELARAWDEGHSAHPYFGVNPYRAKEQA